MPRVRSDRAEAEKDHVSFSKITWVVTEKAGLGLGSLDFPVRCPSPALRRGSLPRSQVGLGEVEPAGGACATAAIWQRLGH